MHLLTIKPREEQTAYCSALSPETEAVQSAAATDTEMTESRAVISVQRKQRTIRRLSKAHLAVSLMPWLNVTALTLYAYTARLNLGHWPQRPDEYLHGAFFAVLSRTLQWSFLLFLFFALPCWFFFFFWRAKEKQGLQLWRALTIFGLGWAAKVMLAAADPVGFLSWFLN